MCQSTRELTEIGEFLLKKIEDIHTTEWNVALVEYSDMHTLLYVQPMKSHQNR